MIDLKELEAVAEEEINMAYPKEQIRTLITEYRRLREALEKQIDRKDSPLVRVLKSVESCDRPHPSCQCGECSGELLLTELTDAWSETRKMIKDE